MLPRSVNRRTLTFLSDEQRHPDMALSAARQALNRQDELAGVTIIVAAENGTFRLTGTVPTERHKQSAAAVVQQAAPGLTIDNQLVVPK